MGASRTTVVSQKGFTLIELIIVILIIGILAATALPRFMSATVDARIAKVQAVFGAIKAAAALAKSRCELDLGRNLVAAGECGNATPQVTMDGRVISIVNRYPAAIIPALPADPGGILEATQMTAQSDDLTVVITAVGPPATISIQVNGASNPANCAVNYTAANAVNVAPTISLSPTFNTGGCN